MRNILSILFLTCQILSNAQTLSTTSISGCGGDGNNCVVTDTRANLINLRNANVSTSGMSDCSFNARSTISFSANGYSAAQLDSIIASLGLPKSSETKTQKIEIIIKNAK